MKIKNKNLFIILFIMLVLLFTIITIFIYLQKKSCNTVLQNTMINAESDNIINTVNEVSTSVTNEINSSMINEQNVITPKTDIQSATKSTTNTTFSNISNNNNSKTNSSNKMPIKNSTSNSTQINSKPIASKDKDTEDKNNTETKDKNSSHTNSNTQPAPTKPNKPIQEDNSRPELANSTYRKTNTSNVQEVINILNSEISKDKELAEFGSKAVKGNKTDAYATTTGFTYLFVNDIQKGKVKGNYTVFPQRVKNNVGAFGTYYVYAEDEYTYDGRGLNPKWSQTLVWIYVKLK